METHPILNALARLKGMSANSDVTITNTGTEFEATRDGLSLGFLKYAIHPDHVDAYTTQVDPATRGQGIASQLVHALVEYATEMGFKIKPTCSYVDSWLTNHPDVDATLRYV